MYIGIDLSKSCCRIVMILPEKDKATEILSFSGIELPVASMIGKKHYDSCAEPNFSQSEIKDAFVKTMKRAADEVKSRFPKEDILALTVAIPSGCGMSDRMFIRSAVEAGFGNIRKIKIIRRNIAAALYCRSGIKDCNSAVIVFDIDENECRVALVAPDKKSVNKLNVIDEESVPWGYREVDNKIQSCLAGYISKSIGRDISAELPKKLRQIKTAFSDPSAKMIDLSFSDDGTEHFELYRQMFEEILHISLCSAYECVNSLYTSYKSFMTISEVCCIGHPEELGAIAAQIASILKTCTTTLSKEPEFAAATGAALYSRSDPINDILGFSYGIEVNAGADSGVSMVSNILKKGMPLPASAVKKYRLRNSSINRICFSVYESEEKEDHYKLLEKDKNLIGTLTLELPEQAVQSQFVYCVFRVGNDGILNVRAIGHKGIEVSAVFELKEV